MCNTLVYVMVYDDCAVSMIRLSGGIPTASERMRKLKLKPQGRV